MANQKLQCICQICSCGRHYCVHRPQPKPKPTGQCVMTEYKDTFRSFPSHEPTRPIKPETAQRSSVKKFDGNTTYKDIFVPHNTKPITKRSPPTYSKPEGVFEGRSSYKHDFFPKQAQKTTSAKPEYNKATYDKPFDGTTVNQETYKAWDLPSPAEFKKPKPAMSLPKGSFNHTTTFQHDFHGHNGQTGRETFNPPGPSLSVGSGKIASETTTRADYGRKYTRPVKSAKPPNSRIQHDLPFENDTTAKNAFKWPKGRPASSCRPEECTRSSGEPLESRTTHNQTYKQWNVPRTMTIRPGVGWTAPSDTFNHKTTVQHDYGAKQGAPAKSARPHYNRPVPGNFDSMTTHTDAFKVWQANPRESFRPSDRYKKPTAHFDGKTTFQTDFVGHKNTDTRPDLCIPKEGGVSFEGNQEFNTMYATTFLGSSPPHCPANRLRIEPGSEPVAGYKYKQDHNGHQYFRGCKSQILPCEQAPSCEK